MSISVVSLFAGCGGLDLGFQQSGYNILWANDFVPDACKTYERNIGNHIICADIDTVNISAIPKANLLIGGPPCQSFSLVGKRDINDSRSNLVWSYLNVLKHVDPEIFLMENVTGLLSARNPDGTKVLDNLITAFNNIGYTTTVHKVNAADYGVPQRRQRVFVVGSKQGFKIDPPHTILSSTGETLPKWVNAEEALSDLPEPNENGLVNYLHKPSNQYQQNMRSLKAKSVDLHVTPYASIKDQELISFIPPGGNYTNVPDSAATTRILNFKRTGGRTTTYGRLSPYSPAYTLNTHFNRLNVGCNIHYSQDRLITLREALRLQSFPDSFEVVSSNKRNYYLQIGNAVPPILSKAWADHLKHYFGQAKLG